MRTWRGTVLAGAVVLLPPIALPCASATAQSAASSDATTPATSPLPASDYHVRNACRAPSHGHASCLAQVLVPATAAARARTHPLGIVRTTPLTAPSPAGGSYGLRPEDLRDAYFPGEPAEVPGTQPAQTIALIEAYNDLDAESDLNTYSREFGIPELATCTAGETSDCFEQVNQAGSTATAQLPFPETTTESEEAQEFCAEREDGSEPVGKWIEKESACTLVEEAAGWSLETSLDIEIAHATCHNCRIVLVEADSSDDEDLEAAEDTAAKPIGSGGVGATEVSNSWGGEEPATDSPAFDHPGTVIAAAAGDDGYRNWTEAEEAGALHEPYYAGADYPASSPHVVAVGGTSLTRNERTGAWQSETVWNDDHEPDEPNNGAGGSGCSTSFQAPVWQHSLPNWSAVGCEEHRSVADVSADGDPYTGVAVYDSESYCEYEYTERGKDYVERTPWCTVGGTSVGTPLIAAMYALAGGSHAVAYPAQTLYEHLETGLLHTVSGANGECDGDYASGCTGSMDPQSARFAFDCGEGVLICNAAPGCAGDSYSGPTGVGSPNGIPAFRPGEDLTKDADACTQTGGQDGAGSDDGGSGSGDSQPVAPTTTPTPGDGGSTASSTSPDSAKAIDPTPLLSDLALTRTATAALAHRTRPHISQIAFAFTLNAPARVRVTLGRLVKTHGRTRWQTLPYSLTIAGIKGRDSAHLRAHGTLAPGRYRLTLTPAGGVARTLTFQIG